MAITPLIEKAVLNGYGTLRNYSLGASGLLYVDIPVGHFAIITDFEYYPYVYGWGIPPGELQNQIEAFTFQEVCFYVNGKPSKWTFKVNYTIGDTVSLGHIYTPVSNFKVDTCLYVDNSIYVIFKNPQMLNGPGLVTDFGTLTNTQNPSSPIGFGTTENTVKSIQNQYGDNYYFPNIQEAGGLSGGCQTVNSTNGHELYPDTIGGAPTSNIQLPLINLQMLIVPEQNRNAINRQ